MRVLILANGEPPEGEWARREAARHDLLMATDGAAHEAARLGLRPHIVSGDFDSIRMDEARAAFPNARFIPTPDQEQADLEKAVQIAIEEGATEITLMGATGNRLDHTLAAFALLLRRRWEAALTLRTPNSSVIALSGTYEAPGTASLETISGDTISVISFDGAAVVTLTGVQWPLNVDTLETATHGVSNVAVGERVDLSVYGGAVLLCRQSRHAF